MHKIERSLESETLSQVYYQVPSMPGERIFRFRGQYYNDAKNHGPNISFPSTTSLLATAIVSIVSFVPAWPDPTVRVPRKMGANNHT